MDGGGCHCGKPLARPTLLRSLAHKFRPHTELHAQPEEEEEEEEEEEHDEEARAMAGRATVSGAETGKREHRFRGGGRSFLRGRSARKEHEKEGEVEAEAEGEGEGGGEGVGEEEVDCGAVELLVVRHGETTWNHTGRLQGQADSELNDAGAQQGLAIAKRLAEEGVQFSSIYTSDLQRAHDTASLIAQACACPLLRARAGLRERHLGVLQGCSLAEARLRHPKAYMAFTCALGANAPIPGGGESQVEFDERVFDTFKAIMANHLGERVVVVCHGGVIRALHWLATGKKLRGKVKNASLSVMRMHTSGQLRVCMAHFNDVTHLELVSFSENAFGGDAFSA